jgi:myosin heavy subunit
MLCNSPPKTHVLFFVQAQPHYIRCINSNSRKQPELFETALVVHQLRCGGVIEAVRVTRARYPARYLVADFVRRFAILHQKEFETEPEQIKQLHDIMKLAGLVEGLDYQVGVSKVFLRDGRVQTLQTRLASIVERSALRIQGNVRLWLAKRAVEARLEAILSLQAVLRRSAGRRAYMLAQSDKYAAIVQCAVRRAVARRPYFILAAATRRMQAVFRVRTVGVWLGGKALMATEPFAILQDKNLARLPKLLAKLEESRLEIAQLKELNSVLITQADHEAAQVRFELK